MAVSSKPSSFLTSHEKTLGVSVNNIDKVRVSRVQTDKLWHALKQRLSRIQGGNASKLSLVQGEKFFSSIARNVGTQRMTNDVKVLEPCVFVFLFCFMIV